MSKTSTISPNDLLRALEKMNYRCIEHTNDFVCLVGEKAKKIAIPVKKVIGEKKLKEICEILEIPFSYFLMFFCGSLNN